MAGFSAQAVYSAFKNDQRKKRKEKEKKKREQSLLEKEMFAYIQNCLSACVDGAMDDIFKEWK